MDESGLRQLLNADVVLGRLLFFPFGRLQGAGVGARQNDVPLGFPCTLSAAALAVPSSGVSVQLFEELTVTDVDGLGSRQLGANSLGGALFPAQRQGVTWVVHHILQVNFGQVGWHRVKVGAFLKAKGARRCLLFPLDGRTLHSSWGKHNQLQCRSKTQTGVKWSLEDDGGCVRTLDHKSAREQKASRE